MLFRSNQEAAVADRTERVEAKSAIVSKRQAMVDTRIATVREKNPEMADIMEDYYGQIMAKIEAVQAKQSAMLAAVQAGEMTGADARVEFKAYVEVEKADIKALIADGKNAGVHGKEVHRYSDEGGAGGGAVKSEAMSILDAYEVRGEAKGYSEKTIQTCINMIRKEFDNLTICEILEVTEEYVDEG